MDWRAFLILASMLALLWWWLAVQLAEPLRAEKVSGQYQQTSYGYKAMCDGSKYKL